MTETSERAVRLLRAKAGELENRVLQIEQIRSTTEAAYIAVTEFKYLAADIALVAGLLADHIERTEGEWIRAGQGPKVPIDDANVRDQQKNDLWAPGSPDS